MHKFRLMTQGDVAQVLDIQAQCYPARLLEDEATIRARLDSAPDSAWVAEYKNRACAYLVGYRSVVGNITPLSSPFDIPAQTDSLYLHDLAVDKSAQGFGLGPQLVDMAWEKARAEGLKYSALVSVQDSLNFWKRLGYEVMEELCVNQTANLHSYGPASSYMVRLLG